MSLTKVPVIDVADVLHEHTLRELAAACSDWGCFQIINHGMKEELVAALHAQMQGFFDLPAARKQAIERTANNPWGFYDRELTKNVRDLKEIFDVGPQAHAGPLAGAVPQWPAGVPRFKSTMLAYFAACQEIARRLLGAISRNLGMPADHLVRDFGEQQTSFLRLNYYPVGGAVKGHLGISHHTDAGAITVMAQDLQPGLQIYHRNEWHTVEPRGDALVVNIGDIVQVWSNDRYRAPLHRVLASAEVHRYSAPFFFNPDYDTNYAPLAGVVSDGEPARYRAINWGEFRAGRAAGDYADYGQEIQISQFRSG